MLPPDTQHDEPAHLQTILIFGMHRSGTSCLAGCLQELGVQLGNVNTFSPFNQKGNRENPAIWPIHDAILNRAGAAWDMPPMGAVSWAPEDIAAMRCFLESYRGLSSPWGFKDPRATLLLDGWISMLPRLRFVASVRHPVAVAKSLAARNGFSEEKSFALWDRYNREVLRWHSVTGCPVVNYDSPHYERAVRHVASRCGLDATGPLTFRSDELTHHHAGDRPPKAIAALWDELREIAV